MRHAVRWFCVFSTIAALAATPSTAQSPRQARPKGVPAGEEAEAAPLPRALRPRVFAVVGGKVMTAAGHELAKATVVVRDGLIEAVGDDVKVPADALVVDAAGKTVYPGLIDACGHWGFDAALRRSEAGTPAPEDFASEALVATKPDNRKGVTPEFTVASALKNDDAAADGWRRAGFTAHLIAPEGGISVGRSAAVSLSGGPTRESLLNADFAQHVSFRPPAGAEYPRVLMGGVAHARQLLLDAQHYRRLNDDATRASRRLTYDPALEALAPALAGRQPVVLEADTRDEIHRALDFAREFNLRPVIVGGQQAWKVADRLQAERVPVILRVGFAEPNEDAERNLSTRARLERNRVRHEQRQNPGRLQAAGVRFAFGSLGAAPDKFLANLRAAIDAGLDPAAALAAMTTTPAALLGIDRTLGTIEPGKAAHLVVADGGPFDPAPRVRTVFADGVRFDVDADDDRPAKPEAKADSKKDRPPLPDTFVGPPSHLDLMTETDADRVPPTRTGGNVLIRGATVFTVANGTAVGDVMVRDGKIAAVGPNLTAPADVAVVDAAGLFLTPGIIDTHSHFAIAGSVNESSLSVVPEVRIRDVVDGDDVQIFRAAAGGVTTARLLHGSANCVGGQDAVIKMKYGRPARELILHDAPRGVKFALGENVKRTDGRFPNTRLGVEAVLVRAFTEARDYQRRWDAHRAAVKAGGTAPPEPRRDLRLEALADMLRGDLKIHCHCYRSDEILMLLRVAEHFGIKIQSLQHVLEGYKIAPEVAAHGASVSLFADWWAYKIEAYDAVPFAAALMHEAGVSVVLKSDSGELMRHMYQEAAKAVKYGGLSPDEALKTITLNAARQLGLDKRLGSIEVGKDADLALFSGHPLNSYARVEMTFVDGECVFQRDRTGPKADGFAAAGPAAPSPKFELPAKAAPVFALRGATVHPAVGPALANATVVVADGRIAALGRNGDVAIPAGAAVIPAEGKHVFPGLIDAGTVIGLAELDSARETLDFREGGDFQPDLRASTAVNPDSELIPVTRANGVLSVVTRPFGSMIAGQSALMNLAGWTPREMAVVDPLALHVEFPSGLPYFSFFDPTVAPMGRNLAKKQREEKVRRLRDLFRQAVAYDAGRPATANPRLEALLPYAKGQRPVIIEAQRAPEISEALKFADEMKLKVIICGAVDAWKVADELKRRDVPVIVGPTMAMPQDREDPFDAAYANPAHLARAGVRFCIRSEGGSNARNLPYQAAMAVSYGLSPDEGLKAVTLYPAQILGVGDQLGSIEVGKRANLVVTNGDLLQASSQVLGLCIDGKLMEPASKQTRLYERYRERLREVKEGRSSLGTR
jgi:imidazolonepropionase-like amidohydrolase